jgi:hypothetical protein
MANPEETTRLKPPYGSTKWYEDFLDTIRRRKLTKVDSEFLKVVAPHNEAKMKLGLRFLGLIEEDGTCTERLNSLMIEGEDEFRQRLAQVIKEAYADVFSSINLEKALKKDVTNHFIENLKMAISSANQATTIFSYLAQKAGIELSDDLKIKEVRKATGERKTPKRIFEPKKDERKMTERLPDEVLARFELKDTGYVDIKSKDDFEIAKAYWKALAKKLGITEEIES